MVRHPRAGGVSGSPARYDGPDYPHSGLKKRAGEGWRFANGPRVCFGLVLLELRCCSLRLDTVSPALALRVISLPRSNWVAFRQCIQGGSSPGGATASLVELHAIVPH